MDKVGPQNLRYIECDHGFGLQYVRHDEYKFQIKAVRFEVIADKGGFT